ncbi:MAG TPA: molybdenum cofactor biosynthesis protein MoaE [Verrucomicrobiae bacterium]|nr:molybdenum cofactor biosynthesis protein MoaE [Verrucomicrobiae bacterium]
MRIDLTITTADIDEVALARAREMSTNAGAVITFHGVVRDCEGEQKISGIDYEAFEPMARRQFEHIFAETGARWPIEAIRLVHRVGYVPVNKPSLWVEVTASHRREAFEACQYIIDQMKVRVPIWKHPRQ